MSGLHMKAIYTRTRTAGAEDVAVTTHDLWHDGSDWTDAQMDAAAAPLATFWSTIAASAISSQVKLTEIRCYKGYDGDGSPGAVDRVKTYTTAGGASQMCPPQIACTVTEITDSRKHWGRFYIPGIATTVLANDGTLLSANVTSIATAADTMYKAWGALPDNTTPIVWSRSSHPIEYLGVAPPRWRPSWVYPSGTVWDEPVAVSVQALRVDEILDVQRPRRYQATQIRVTKQLS